MLSYLGLSVGNFWDYRVIPWGNNERDSVVATYNLPLYGSCTDIYGKIAKVYVNRDTLLDSTFIWYGNNYFHSPLYRFAKYNPYIGDTWEAWNDCLLPLNTKIPFIDMDMDGITDTIIYRPSQANVESLNDTVSTITGNVKLSLRLKYLIILTSAFSPDSVMFVEVRRFYYKPFFGITKEMWDSTYQTVYYGSSSYPVSYPVGTGKEIILIGVSETTKHLRKTKGFMYDISGRRTSKRFKIAKGNLGIR